MVLEVNLKNAAMLPVGVGVGYRKLGLALEFGVNCYVCYILRPNLKCFKINSSHSL